MNVLIFLLVFCASVFATSDTVFVDNYKVTIVAPASPDTGGKTVFGHEISAHINGDYGYYFTYELHINNFGVATRFGYSALTSNGWTSSLSYYTQKINEKGEVKEMNLALIGRYHPGWLTRTMEVGDFLLAVQGGLTGLRHEIDIVEDAKGNPIKDTQYGLQIFIGADVRWIWKHFYFGAELNIGRHIVNPSWKDQMSWNYRASVTKRIISNGFFETVASIGIPF